MSKLFVQVDSNFNMKGRNTYCYAMWQ